MNDNDLRALLYDALGELRVLASYLEDDYPWPNAGLRMTAKAHDRMVKRIEAALGAEPAEEVPLRQENLALRAALRVRSNDEEWRAKFLEAETRCVEAIKERDRLQEHYKVWEDVARKIIEMFDPLHPGADHVLLMYVAKGVKQANENLRAIKAKASRAADLLGQEAECEGLRLDNIDLLAEKVITKLRDLESQLEDADLVTQDALGHATAGLHQENVRLKTLLRDVAVDHLLGQPSDWEGPGGRKESYEQIRALLGDDFEDRTW